jgi:hypothetical protein
MIQLDEREGRRGEHTNLIVKLYFVSWLHKFGAMSVSLCKILSMYPNQGNQIVVGWRWEFEFRNADTKLRRGDRRRKEEGNQK